MTVLSELVSSKSVVDMLKEKGHLDWAVATFARSGSFETAGRSAVLIGRVANFLTKEQLEEVLNAMDSNEQIRFSYSAQNNLDSFLAWVSGKVDSELLKRVKGRFVHTKFLPKLPAQAFRDSDLALSHYMTRNIVELLYQRGLPLNISA